MKFEFNLKDKHVLDEQNDPNYDSDIKPGKSKSRFKRGNLVLCLIFYPDSKRGEFKNLLKEETMLTDKVESLKFLIVEKPALEFAYKNKSFPVYICDAEKGTTVNLNFEREKGFASVYCDPHMISNIFDLSFISKASNIKPDWKQLLGIALFGLSFGFLFGLCF